MSKDKDSQLFVSINEYVVPASLLYLHVDNIENYDKQYIVTNIEFETIMTSIKKKCFHQRMVDFLNKLELSDQKIPTNETIRNDHYKRKLL